MAAARASFDATTRTPTSIFDRGPWPASIAAEDSAVHRVADLERRAGALVQPLGVVPLPKKPLLVVRPPEEPWDWVVLQLEDDPAYLEGRLGIPAATRARLRDVVASGANFDRLLIAHEVPKHSPPESPKPTELVAETVSAHAKRWAAKVDRLAQKTSGAVTSGAEAVGQAVAAMAADPVLIGAIDIPTSGGSDLVAAFHLASWRN